MSEFRRRIVDGFRNAFDLGPQGPVEPTPSQRAAIDRILGIVVRRGMVGPATLFLESARPLNNIGANALRFFEPIASAVVDQAALRDLSEYLRNRGSVDWLIRRLDVLEREAAGGTFKSEGGDRRAE
ncbi:MAG: hypothetical protein U0572_06510 [Phycisphaerales bacterium]